MTGNYAKGYVQDATGNIVEYPPSDPSMGGASLSMISNMYNLQTWAKALANGALLSPAMQQQRLTFVSTDQAGVQYGLGIEKKGNWLGHEGIALGFNTSMFYMPSRDATIVIIANLNKNPPRPADEILKGLTEVFFPESPHW